MICPGRLWFRKVPSLNPVSFKVRKWKTFWQRSGILHQNRQELLILKFVDQLSNAEIGQIMRKSEGAIKSLYHRTLLELRENMEKEQEKEQQ